MNGEDSMLTAIIVVGSIAAALMAMAITLAALGVGAAWY